MVELYINQRHNIVMFWPIYKLNCIMYWYYTVFKYLNNLKSYDQYQFHQIFNCMYCGSILNQSCLDFRYSNSNLFCRASRSCISRSRTGSTCHRLATSSLGCVAGMTVLPCTLLPWSSQPSTSTLRSVFFFTKCYKKKTTYFLQPFFFSTSTKLLEIFFLLSSCSPPKKQGKKIFEKIVCTPCIQIKINRVV